MGYRSARTAQVQFASDRSELLMCISVPRLHLLNLLLPGAIWACTAQ